MAGRKLVRLKAKSTRSLKSSERTIKQSHPLLHLSDQDPQTEFLDDTEETGVECLDRFWSGVYKRGSAKYSSPKKACKIIRSIQENDTRSYVHDKVKLHDGKLLSEMFSNYIKGAKAILDNYMKQDFVSGSSRRWFLDGESKEGDDEDIAGREFAEFLARKDLAKLPKHHTKDKGKPLYGFSSSKADPVLAFRNGDTGPSLRRAEAQETLRVAKKAVRFKRPSSSVLDLLSVISSEDERAQTKSEEQNANHEAFEQTKLADSFINKEVSVHPKETSLPVVQKYKLDDRPIPRVDSLRASRGLASYQNKGFESAIGTVSNGLISKANENHTNRRVRKTKQVRNDRPVGRQDPITGRNNNFNSAGGDLSSNKTTTKLTGNDSQRRALRKCQVRVGRKASLAKISIGLSLNSGKQSSSPLPAKTMETNTSTSSSVNVSSKPLKSEKGREMPTHSKTEQYDIPFDKTNDEQAPKSEAATSKEAKPHGPNKWNKTLRIMKDISLSSTQHRSWEEADYSKLSKLLGVPMAKLPTKSQTLLRNDTDLPIDEMHKNSVVPERATGTSDRSHDKGVSSSVMKAGKTTVLETSLKKPVLLQRPTLKKYDSLGVGKTAEVTKLSQFVRYEFDIPDDLDANLEHLSLHGYLHG
eukprot:Seg2620.2 transcript_id=Seg2620.2/GoldUCD/mRNA.D3Y31 product="hypothetical protein" protein_id=Seg2620.2/GoldUCD/D3Y31